MISAVILTKNAERTLLPLLELLKSLNVVVIDTGSTDKTLEIISSFSNVELHTSPFTGFGQLKNEGALYAKHDWIISLDADELPSKQLLDFLKKKLDPSCIYSFPFYNFYKKKRIYGCGWNPESHIRLYNKKRTSFSEDLVHEKIIEKGLSIRTTSYPIEHYSYLCIDDFLRKLQHYTTLFAEQNHGRKKSSFFKAFSHGAYAFFRSYILKRGFIDGKEGIIISWYNGSVAFIKYLKLAEKSL